MVKQLKRDGELTGVPAAHPHARAGAERRESCLATSPDVAVTPAGGASSPTDGASVQLLVNKSQAQTCTGGQKGSMIEQGERRAGAGGAAAPTPF